MHKNSNILIGVLVVTSLLLLTPVTHCSAKPEKYSLSGLKITPPSQPEMAVTLGFTFSHQKGLKEENQSSYLKKVQVQIFEEGKTRDIKGELKKTDRTIKGKSVVIAIDHSVSMAGSKLRKVKKALNSFINKTKDLSPLAVVGFNKSDQTLISDFGSDPKKIKKGISELSAYGKTPLYDTVFYTTSILNQRKGANYLIFITDGKDTSSSKKLEAALKRAKDNNLTVYTLTPTGFDESQKDMEKDLRKLSTETGGSLIDGLNVDRLTDFFKNLNPRISEKYSLKYKPIDSESNCERTVELRIKKGGKQLSQSSIYQFPDTIEPDIKPDQVTLPKVTNKPSIKVPFTFTDNCSLKQAVIQGRTYNLDVRKDDGVVTKTVRATIELQEGNNEDINASVVDMSANKKTLTLPDIYLDTKPPELKGPGKRYKNKKKVGLPLSFEDNYKLDQAIVSLPDEEKEFDLKGQEDNITASLKLQEKSTEVKVKVEDLAGNAPKYTRKLIFDPNPPELNIDIKPALETCNGNLITNKSQVSLKISAKDSHFDEVKLGDDDDPLDCRKDNEKYLCDTVARLSSGANKISATAKDKAGNKLTKARTLVYDKQNPSIEIAGDFSQSTVKPEVVLPLKFTDNRCLRRVNIKNEKIEVDQTITLKGEEQGLERIMSLEKLEKELTQKDGVNEIKAVIKFNLEDKAGNTEPMDKEVTFSPGIINKDTSETYSDIHKAVESANPGDTLQIGRMEITGNITIKKELTLTGLGSDKTTLKSAKMGLPVIEIKGVPSGVTIKNLHVKSQKSECTDSQKDICPYAIYVKGKSKAKITNSVLSNSSMAAVKVSDESRVEVSSSELTGSKHGLAATANSKALLAETKISNNTSHGIIIQNNSKAEIIRNCLVTDNMGAGIRIQSSGKQIVQNSEIKENGYGVVVSPKVNLLLEGNVICTNQQHDLAAFSRACGFDKSVEEFSGKIISKDNSICSVCPRSLLSD